VNVYGVRFAGSRALLDLELRALAAPRLAGAN
jgi:hypothetical protein